MALYLFYCTPPYPCPYVLELSCPISVSVLFVFAFVCPRERNMSGVANEIVG